MDGLQCEREADTRLAGNVRRTSRRTFGRYSPQLRFGRGPAGNWYIFDQNETEERNSPTITDVGQKNTDLLQGGTEALHKLFRTPH